MRDIEINEIIEKWQNRIKFLISWQDRIINSIKGDIDMLTECELLDKVYQLETEIESKQMFIDTYKKDQEKRKQQVQQAVDHVNKGFGPIIKLLRKKEPDHPAHKEMRKGILKRFARGYKSMQSKIHDYNNACELVK